jgi:hypothetical protein
MADASLHLLMKSRSLWDFDTDLAAKARELRHSGIISKRAAVPVAAVWFPTAMGADTSAKGPADCIGRLGQIPLPQMDQNGAW